MKKVLLLTALLLSAGIAANAQWKFGVKAGASYSGMGMDNFDSRWGFNTGVLAQYKFAESKLPLALQTEVLYSMQGSKYDIGVGGLRAKGKYDLDYINVPMMVQGYILPGLNIEIGPQFGFLVGAKNKPDDLDDIDVKDNMKTFDFSLAMGAAYELSVIPVGFYARYTLGLTDIWDNTPSSSDSGKNRVLQFGAFVKF